MEVGKYFVMVGTFIIVTSLIFLIPDKKVELQNNVKNFTWKKFGIWKKRRTLFQMFILGLITLHIVTVHYKGLIIPSICPRSSTDLATTAGLFGLSSVFWLIMYLLVFIWGRVLCSWFCVYSFVQERSNDLLRASNKKVSNVVKNNIIIYIVTSVFWGSVIYNVTKYFLTNNTLEFNISNGYKVADLWVFYGGMITLLPLTMFLSYYFGNRFFCKYVCPVGGLMSLYSRFSLLKIKIDHTKCKNCKRCARECQMGVQIDQHIREKAPAIIDKNCIACGDCIDVCKFSAMKYGLVLNNNKKQPVQE
jgi:ferredoxin-type protein NapH